MSDELEHEFSGHRRFAIRRRIGAGGMGVVYHAYDRERGHDVALKTLKIFAGAHLYRLKREFRALADVSHPNLVTLYELFSERDLWFMTMELVRGATFLDYVWRLRAEPDDSTDPTLARPRVSDLRLTPIPSPVPRISFDDEATTAHDKQTPLPGSSIEALLKDDFSTEALHRSVIARSDPERLFEALRQLAAGVSALHAAGKLHRDIKPSNILVTPSGRVVLLDFGLVTDSAPDALRSLTRDGIAGTLAYMAPEQSSGRPTTAAADWYGVGVVLFEALTGRLPWEGSGVEMLMQRMSGPPPRPSRLVSDVPQALDDLCVDLLAPAPEARPAEREIMQRLGVTTRAPSSFHLPEPRSVEAGRQAAPFVGRNRHIAALEDAFARARSGEPTFVHVRGPTGIGKTALVRRFLGELRKRESSVVLAGRCHERESVPFKAIDGLVDALSQYLSRLSRREASILLPRNAGALCRMFPVLERVEAVAGILSESIERNGPRTPEVDQKRAFVALREICRRIGESAPVVLFIDDLQWGDVESLAALSVVLAGDNASGASANPDLAPSVLLIACSRTEDEKRSPVLNALGRDRRLLGVEPRVLPIAGLTTEESRDLALSLMGTTDGSAFQRAEAIAREARGSPFFVEALARHSLKEPASGTDEIRLDSVLRARLSKLSLEAKRLLEVVCVAGRAVPENVATQAARVPSEQEQPVLAALKSVNFVKSTRNEGRSTLEPFHARVAETVTAHMTADERRAAHLALAQALESIRPPDAEAIHAHFRKAEDAVKSAEWAKIAGDEASKLLAFHRAAGFYSAALEADSPPGTALTANARTDIHEKWALALMGCGRGLESARILLKVAEQRTGVDAERLRRQAGQQLLGSGHVDEGSTVLASQLHRLGERLPPNETRAFAARLLRSAQLWQQGMSFESKREDEIDPLVLERIDTLAASASGLFLIDLGRGFELSGRNLLSALRVGEPDRVLRAIAIESCYASALGLRVDRRRQLEATAKELAESLGTPHARALRNLTDGVNAFMAGENGLAMAQLEAAEPLLRDQCAGAAAELTIVRTFLHSLLFQAGRLQVLSRRVTELAEDAEARGDLLTSTELRIGDSSAVWLASDNPERALRLVDEAMARFEAASKSFPRTAQTYFAAVARTNAYLYSGQGAKALEVIREAWSWLKDSMLIKTRPVLSSALTLRAKATIAAAVEDPSFDGSAAEADIKELQRESARWAAPTRNQRKDAQNDPLVTMLRAGLLSLTDNRSKAAALLELTLPTLSELGWVSYARAARLLLGKTGVGAPSRELLESAEHEFRDEGIKNPLSFASMLIPGRFG